MKRTYKLKDIILYFIVGLAFASCTDLDVKPLNIIDDETVFTTESGINSYLTTLYADLPIEDFRFGQKGFNVTGSQTVLAHVSGEAMRSVNNDINSIGDGTWWGLWDYGKIRRVNSFIQKLPGYKNNFTQAKYDTWLGEAYYIRAYYYFAMVKRYGGVPILKEPQQWTGDTEVIKVPRDTEKDCYDFIAEDLDLAIEYFEKGKDFISSEYGTGRANADVAYALKSRAMLYAGTIARYGKVDLDGLVGIDSQYANHYFELAYNAAKAVDTSGKYELYRGNTDKEKNFAELFLAEDSKENIFIKKFKRNTNAHGWDIYMIPYQYRGAGYSSDMNPPLEFIEMFERLDGTPADFKQRATGTEFDDPSDLFDGLDARFGGSIIYPNAVFKGEACSIQKGLVIENGNKQESAVDYEKAVYKAQDGTEYHIVGKSGCGKYAGNMTGFFARKYLNENMSNAEVKESYSEQHWIDFRLAEVYLNGIEAAVEWGQHADDALVWINDIRDRAGLKKLTAAELTVEKVRRERRIELAFESHAYWDLRRWRTADGLFETKQFTAFYPFYDIRSGKYIYETAPANSYYYTFDTKMYYECIPETERAKNEKLLQNPFYN